MSVDHDKPDSADRPWWMTPRGAGAAAVLFLLCVLVAAPLTSLVMSAGWMLFLLVLTGWLVIPDLWWAWREHPEVVRRVLRFLANPRTVRVMLYVALAAAWFYTLFD